EQQKKPPSSPKKTTSRRKTPSPKEEKLATTVAGTSTVAEVKASVDHVQATLEEGLRRLKLDPKDRRKDRHPDRLDRQDRFDDRRRRRGGMWTTFTARHGTSTASMTERRTTEGTNHTRTGPRIGTRSEDVDDAKDFILAGSRSDDGNTINSCILNTRQRLPTDSKR
uniref:WH2 domain-containing protein n=1 Tax=Steinernema glaseri TaxID=37863 RepID=A0A1I7ZCH8_9BILA